MELSDHVSNTDEIEVAELDLEIDSYSASEEDFPPRDLREPERYNPTSGEIYLQNFCINKKVDI